MIWYMSRRPVLIGLVGGIAVSPLVLLVLPEMTRSAERTRAFFDFAGLRTALLWFALLGAALGAAIISSRRYPLVVAVPAVLLGFGYYVLSPTGWTSLLGTWIPESVVLRIPFSFGSAALVLVGVLAAVAVWRIWQIYRQKPSSSGDGVGRRDMVVGTLAGIGSVVALLPILGRVELALSIRGSLLDFPGMRMAMLGLFVIGVVFGALVIVSERFPFLGVSAATALVLFVVLHPMFGIFPSEGTWSFLVRNRLSLSPGIVLITGILLAVTAWRLLPMRHPDSRVAAQG
jgi:hypothetical protein